MSSDVGSVIRLFFGFMPLHELPSLGHLHRPGQKRKKAGRSLSVRAPALEAPLAALRETGQRRIACYQAGSELFVAAGVEAI
jgi:hypothetical protein